MDARVEDDVLGNSHTHDLLHGKPSRTISAAATWGERAWRSIPQRQSTGFGRRPSRA